MTNFFYFDFFKVERDELTRELEREQDLAIGIEDRLEEIKRSIEEMSMNVGVKVSFSVFENLFSIETDFDSLIPGRYCRSRKSTT